MNHGTTGLPIAPGIACTLGRITVVLTALLLTACGGGGGGTNAAVSGPAAGCEPADPDTFAECGTVYVGLTDADGDILNYTVDVLQLTLQTADGRTVETLPRSTRINFTDYVDMTELLTAAMVPPAVYVSGSITLDYSDAEVFVEADGEAKQAIVTDTDGTPLAQTTLNIVLPDRDRLVISRGRPSLLQLDFDLGASHTVDVVPTPATVLSEQFIVAEIDPIDEKNIRVRGPLVEVVEDASTYVVSIRPFRDRLGDFGEITVHTTNETEFEVDGIAAFGAEGLRALAAAGTGTPTVAAGTLDVSARIFTAELVLAGTSVPGIERDAVVGNVIARDGNFLTVRGATLVPSDRRAYFHDDVIVEIGPDTKVVKDGDRLADLGTDAISIGQRVTVRGNLPDAVAEQSAPQILFDATAGAVRMHLTHLSGIVNTVMPGQTDITLHAIDRRRAQVFDFTGTGKTPLEDAVIENYEVATGNLSVADFAEGKPIVAYGFPSAFGAAPPDFIGRTVIDYTDVRSSLGVGWGSAGSVQPFLSMGVDGLLLDNGNPDIDVRHHVKQGPVLIDLPGLDSDTLIAARRDGRNLFYIKASDSLRLYTNFDDFVADLVSSLDGTTPVRSMHARGKYDAGTNVFSAYKIGIHLLQP